MKRLHRVLVAVAIVVMGVALARHWALIPQAAWDLRPGLLSASVVLLVLLFFVGGYGWHLILAAMGESPGARRSVRIWILSLVTRYVPGGFWGYASRATMGREAGIPLAVATVSLYLETLLLTITSLAVGLPALVQTAGLPLSPSQAGLGLAGLLVLLHPRLLGLLGRLPGRAGAALRQVVPPSGRALVLLSLFYVAYFLLFGAAFALFVAAIYPLDPSAWIHVASSVALAFCAGFVSVVFPSGIGIRESVLYLLLMQVMPEPVSLAVAVGSRVWSIVGEGLALVVVALSRAGATPWDAKRTLAPRPDALS